jgi:casein kinase 1
MTGIGEQSNQVFLIDFGLAQLFCNPSTRRHIQPVSGLKTVGTITFTSINSHSGQMQTCCNDLESLVYSIIYLCHGSLPWQDIIKGDHIEQYEVTVLKKKTALAKRLCHGLPSPFVAFMQHIQSLGFDEKPKYDYLHALLMQCSAHDSNGVVLDLVTILPSLCKIHIPSPRGQHMCVQPLFSRLKLS